jgi:hypothetical protein
MPSLSLMYVSFFHPPSGLVHLVGGEVWVPCHSHLGHRVNSPASWRWVEGVGGALQKAWRHPWQGISTYRFGCTVLNSRRDGGGATVRLRSVAWRDRRWCCVHRQSAGQTRCRRSPPCRVVWLLTMVKVTSRGGAGLFGRRARWWGGPPRPVTKQLANQQSAAARSVW